MTSVYEAGPLVSRVSLRWGGQCLTNGTEPLTHYTEGPAMKKHSTLYVGMDTEKEGMSVAYAPSERGAEVVFVGPMGTCES